MRQGLRSALQTVRLTLHLCLFGWLLANGIFYHKLGAFQKMRVRDEQQQRYQPPSNLELERRLKSIEDSNIEHRLTDVEATLRTNSDLLRGAVIGIGGLFLEAIGRLVSGARKGGPA